MFPFIPVLILLLMGPAHAERLAVQGRLPASLLAIHRAMVVPVAVIQVSVEELTVEPKKATSKRPSVPPTLGSPRPAALSDVFAPNTPVRAGPSIFA